MSVIFFGPPGVGKGTQSQLICRHYGMAHISTGNILREEIQQGTALGDRVEGILREGKLVGDDLVNEVVKKRIDDLFPDTMEFLFDGYPRTIQQANVLEETLAEFGLDVILVVNLSADKAELIKRLTGRRTCRRCGATYHIHFKASRVPGVCDVCGGELVERADDNVEAVTQRLDEYERSTRPLLHYYGAQDLLVRIEGVGQIWEVQQRIRNSIDALEREPTAM